MFVHFSGKITTNHDWLDKTPTGIRAQESLMKAIFEGLDVLGCVPFRDYYGRKTHKLCLSDGMYVTIREDGHVEVAEPAA